MKNKIIDYIKLIRVKHYFKNFLIFIPLFFNCSFFVANSLIKTIEGFFCFSLICSIIYIINDINDRKKDKLHPVKCKRPIASGKISVKSAIISAIVLFLTDLLLIYIFKINYLSILFLTIYFVINMGYSFGLKNIPLVDIVILVSGFLLRILYGASLTNIEVSNWLYLTIISISFYLSLGKRRNEIIKNGNKTRNVLKYYNKEFLDKNMYMCLTMAIVFYSLWSITIKENSSMMWTVPIIIILCMKYSMNIEGNDDGDPIEVITGDISIIVLTLIFCITTFLILYL